MQLQTCGTLLINLASALKTMGMVEPKLFPPNSPPVPILLPQRWGAFRPARCAPPPTTTSILTGHVSKEHLEEKDHLQKRWPALFLSQYTAEMLTTIPASLLAGLLTYKH